MGKLRVGIIGTGLIGKKRALSLTERHDLVGAFDSKTENFVEFQKLFSVPEFESAERLIQSVGKGGLVIICTTHDSLAKLGELAVKQGCHVLLEKPGGRSFSELKPISDLAETKGVVFRVGYNHRFHPSFIKLKEITESKQYGAIQLIRARYGHGGRVGYEKEWRAQKKVSGGGELLDQGSHLIDLSQFLTGSLTLRYADTPTLYWDMEVEDNAFLSLSSDEGARVWLHASWTEWKNLFSFEVFFKTAKIEVTGLGGSYGEETLTKFHMISGLGIPEMESQIFAEEDSSWRLEILDIENQINGLPFIGATVEESLRTLKVIEEAYS